VHVKKHIVVLCLAALALCARLEAGVATNSQAESGARYDNFGSRFVYSQCILWPSSVATDLAVIHNEGFHPREAYSWSQWERTFNEPPFRDEDHWSWNYLAHPFMGSTSYLAYRNCGGSWFEGFIGAALNSVIYEYAIAGAMQQPSYNDMIITPILGSILGESTYRLNRWFVKDRYLTILERIAVTLLDPFEVIYHRFNYRKMAGTAYR